MMSLWDALRMNMMISYQELVRTFPNMNEKTLSIDIARLKQVRYSVGIAIGEEKYTGIIGALRGGYINCLVTNRETAERLLK